MGRAVAMELPQAICRTRLVSWILPAK